MITSLGNRWQNFQLSRFRINRNIHETIECTRNAVFGNAIFLDGVGDVAKASLVRVLVAMNDAKGVFRARCEEEVMSSASVFNNFEHDVAPIGVERVTSCEVYPARVVESPTVRDHFFRIVPVECD